MVHNPANASIGVLALCDSKLSIEIREERRAAAAVDVDLLISIHAPA